MYYIMCLCLITLEYIYAIYFYVPMYKYLLGRIIYITFRNDFIAWQTHDQVKYKEHIVKNCRHVK